MKNASAAESPLGSSQGYPDSLAAVWGPLRYKEGMGARREEKGKRWRGGERREGKEE